MRDEYGFDMDPGMPGQMADASHKVADSYAAESVIYPGRGVVLGTNPQTQIKAVTTSTDTFAGIAQLNMAMENPIGNGAISYAATDTVPVMTFGRIWAETVGAVTAGGAVYMIPTGDNAGKFTATATATDNITVARATFKTTTDADGIAVVELR